MNSILLDRSILSCGLHFFVFQLLGRYLHLGIYFNIERTDTYHENIWFYSQLNWTLSARGVSIHLHLCLCLHLIRNYSNFCIYTEICFMLTQLSKLNSILYAWGFHQRLIPYVCEIHNIGQIQFTLQTQFFLVFLIPCK